MQKAIQLNKSTIIEAAVSKSPKSFLYLCPKKHSPDLQNHVEYQQELLKQVQPFFSYAPITTTYLRFQLKESSVTQQGI